MPPDTSRLTSDVAFTPEAFRAEAARRGAAIARYGKIGWIAANPAKPGRRYETYIDYVAMTLNANGELLRDSEGQENIYLIDAVKLSKTYERTERSTEFGPAYRPRNIVQAFALPEGFDILAPWRERQRGYRGYLVLNGEDIYAVHADVFERTYKRA